jgi:hypothetical protein
MKPAQRTEWVICPKADQLGNSEEASEHLQEVLLSLTQPNIRAIFMCFSSSTATESCRILTEFMLEVRSDWIREEGGSPRRVVPTVPAPRPHPILRYKKSGAHGDVVCTYLATRNSVLGECHYSIITTLPSTVQP